MKTALQLNLDGFELATLLQGLASAARRAYPNDDRMGLITGLLVSFTHYLPLGMNERAAIGFVLEPSALDLLLDVLRDEEERAAGGHIPRAEAFRYIRREVLAYRREVLRLPGEGS